MTAPTVTITPVDPGSAGPQPTREQRPPKRAGGLPALSWILPIRIGQIAVWQIAILAVLASIGSGQGRPGRLPPLDIADYIVIGVAALTFLLTSVRIAGLCGYQWIAVYSRFRDRQREAKESKRKGEPGGDPVRAVLPNLQTRQHVDRAGNRVGLAKVDDGWTAVLRLSPRGRTSPAALVSTMRAAYGRTDIPLSSMELVAWTMPGPLDVDADSGAPKAEPIRVFWLAVRYRPSDAPLAAIARGGEEIGALRATASAALRLGAELARVGYSCAVLDEPELRQELFIALGCDRAGGNEIKETWRTWSVGRMRQSCFSLRNSGDVLLALNRWAPGAAFSSTSLLFHRTPHGKVRREVTVRIGLPHNRKTKPEQLAAGLNIGLVPLHGRHADHVRGALPLAIG
jgi:type VII secretion protein EccE